jgi:hypothetical protein
VTNQHKLRLAADGSYLAASLKVPPPKNKIVRSEGASQRLIREVEGGPGRDAEGETIEGLLASEISAIFLVVSEI